MKAGLRYRDQYRKPVIYDECKYEGDVPQGWGNLTPREMTQRFWLGTLSGCYVGHGETYKHPQDILWWAKGGVLQGESPKRIQWLKQFMAQSPPFHELQPQGDANGRYLLAKPSEYYLLYCVNQRPQTLLLAGERPYKVDEIDPWHMTITPVVSANPGGFTISAPTADLAYRLTPYKPGEKLRPSAKITASVTEGLPPLTVKFDGPSGLSAQWDFGDGASSRETAPSHTFQKPGLYPVTLTVTDADGGSARTFLQIAVERNMGEPIVRAAVPARENTPLKFHGTARRTASGSLHLPGGAPWGWVEADSAVMEHLRGLRSFTLMGWLKPESLQVGSGGNRIAFCLNHDRSGFDLVSHADGRLRLSVNQWPDSVQNDSSPGKLQLGKWTFFAVTYDVTHSRENVCWYFSAPTDAPEKPAISLDRKTSYNVGPLGADIGPLTIGNFNQTMRGYGLDRQFRGEIFGFQLFGSRIGSRGALPMNEILKHIP